MSIKVWSLFEKFKLSELNNNFSELANRTVNRISWGTNQNVDITANPTSNKLAVQDLNTITTTGVYWGGGDNTSANKPSGVVTFGLFVYNSAGKYITQDLTEGNINPQKRWSRQYSGSTWSSWIEIYTTRLDGSETPTASNLGTITTHTAIRRGGVCRYKLAALSGTWTGGTTYNLCTLSLNYRPIVAFSKRIMLTETINAVFIIGTDGNVYIKPSGSINAAELRIDETYTI